MHQTSQCVGEERAAVNNVIKPGVVGDLGWFRARCGLVSAGVSPWHFCCDLVPIRLNSRWRHQMEIFSALLAICEGNPPIIGGFPSRRPVTRNIDVFFDRRLNKWLSKPRRRWFETLSHSFWRQCNVPNIHQSNNIMLWSLFRVSALPMG